jgi:cytochrome P450
MASTASQSTGGTPTIRDPYEELRELTGGAEPSEDIRWNEERGVWMTGSYRAFKEVSQHPELFLFPGTDASFAPDWFDADFYVWFEGGPKKLPFLSPSEHDALHRWWITQFNPRVVEGWREDVIRPQVHEATTRSPPKGGLS